MILRLIKPAAALTPFIKTYWYLKNDSSDRVSQTIVPNGLMGLCFYRSGALDYSGLGIFTIAAVFLARALIGCYWMLDNGHCPFTDLSSVVVSGGIGLLYLLGGVKRLKTNESL